MTINIRSNATIFDDFGDNLYSGRVLPLRRGSCLADVVHVRRCCKTRPEWTVVSEKWSASNGTLSKDVTANWGEIYFPSTLAYGTWQRKYKLGSTEENHQDVARFVFINKDNCYYQQVRYAGEYILRKVVKGTDSALISETWTADTSWHTAKVTRASDNTFELFLDGVSKGTVKDSSITTCDRVDYVTISTSAAVESDEWLLCK